jgi:hypothetical protein
MQAKDVRKGSYVRLRNGMEATLLDNQVRRATRLAYVFGSKVGMYDEAGSVYTSDIVAVRTGEEWEPVEHSRATLELASARAAWGF